MNSVGNTLNQPNPGLAQDTNHGNGNNPNVDPNQQAAHDAEKAKYVGEGFNGGWAKMTHWYKEHPEEIDDIMFDGAEHDAAWYQEKPKERMGDLVRDYLDHQSQTNPQDSQDNEPNPNQDNGANKVEIGEINISKIELIFSDYEREKLDQAEQALNELQPKLAELYATNRRLIKGAKNRAELVKIEGEYGKILDEYLKLKADDAYEKGKHNMANQLETKLEELRADIEQKLTDFAGGDLAHSDKTQEELDAEKTRLVEIANGLLTDAFHDYEKQLKTDVNVDFQKNFNEQHKKLKHATNEALDTGTACRKVVSKILNNKYLKGTLVAATTAGLLFTGVGAVAGVIGGTMAIGTSYTLGGVALGAVRGGLSGLIMSRQDSKTSAVNNFVSEEEIKNKIAEIDITSQSPDVANVASWYLEKYHNANVQDAKSNRKRTLIATGLGATIGGAMSGLSINTIKKTDMPTNIQGTTSPVEYGGAENLNQVDIPKGKGLFEVFRQLGGKDADNQKALEIAQSITSKYNAQGSGGLADVYPGKISNWPDVARSYITEISEAWANQELVPRAVISGGDTVFDYTTEAVTTYIPHAFMNILTQLTASIGLPSTIGRAIGDMGSRANNPETVQTPPETPPTNSPNAAPTSETIDSLTAKIVNNTLETFKLLSLYDKSDVARSIEHPTMVIQLSPVAQKFLANYNSATPDVQRRIFEAIQEHYNIPR